MQQQIKNQPIGKSLFFSLLILTAFLILAEISFLIECSGIYLSGFKLIANHLGIPRAVVPGILYFVGVELLIHLFFTFFVWITAVFFAKVFNFSEQATERFGIKLWIVSLLTVLFANRVFFPNSKFSSLLLSVLSLKISGILFALLSLLMMSIFLLALFGLVLSIFHQLKNKKMLAGAAALVSLCAFMFYFEVFFHAKNPVIDAATAKKPNIIIIGIDSVRPDFLGFFGYAKKTPHIDDFLNHAAVFSDALTPLARTYPSWVSILTGIYPKLNSIRTNLADQSHLDLSETLPAILREDGYQTIFATDDTRFSNIDQRYGFDKVMSPPIGFNDFLLGTINDFPLSNFLINTWIGKYLFPYSYANRGVFVTYNPNSFLKLLQPVLSESRIKPTLLITHFCLPHYPYAWARLPLKQVSISHYHASLARVDKQFYDFMAMLKQNNFLEHSIVILLSDHGEAVEIQGDRITDPDLYISSHDKKPIPRFYPPSMAKEKVNMSGGHGTDVLGLPQYHTVLAFRTFGTMPNQIKIIPGFVSVMDVKPTILKFLNLPIGRSSGDFLQDYVFGFKNIVDIKEDFFVESDFSPEAIRTIHPEERKVLFEGIDYYRIEPKTTRIVVKDSMWRLILASKQYADYYDSWVLALYPQKNKMMVPVLVDLKTGKWTMDLESEFAKQSPARHMLTAMRVFFGDDLTPVFYEN
ncbi:MAG TPA: sulfatase-like hydrolase/transferase [Gammaproteobacteria bacterium]|nr:sulfatase-like hydrolase/transferase [Gammaproteobacteria bacterium]